MTVRRDIPLEEFSIIISPPVNRLASTCVNIYEDGKFNMNGKLAEKLGGKEVAIKLLPDGKYLCLQENGNILFPKSGSRKIPEIVEILKSKGITFPARYELQYSKVTQSWQGACEENPIKLPSRKVRNTKK